MTVPPKALPLVQLVQRRTDFDCGLVAIAMYFGLSYEDTLAHAAQVTDVKVHRKGVFVTQIQRIAKQMGVQLVAKRTWDIENDFGILVGDYLLDNGVKDRHAVLLKQGLIWDVDLGVWEPEDYFVRFTPMMIVKKP